MINSKVKPGMICKILSRHDGIDAFTAFAPPTFNEYQDVQAVLNDEYHANFYIFKNGQGTEEETTPMLILSLQEYVDKRTGCFKAGDIERVLVLIGEKPYSILNDDWFELVPWAHGHYAR